MTQTPEATIAHLTAERAALVEALRPFAEAADVKLCADSRCWTDAKTIQGTDVAFHIKFGDLRRARALVRDGGL